MTEKSLSIKGINPVALLGVNDKHLRILEDSFDCTIVVRGDQIIIKGLQAEVELLEKIVTELIYLAHQKPYLEPIDVETVLRISKMKNRPLQPTDGKDLESVVLFTHRDVIEVKTKTQKEYVQKSKLNDIVFAIGPAGTGKTYVAVAIALAALQEKAVDRLILCRPAVETGESLGFLPGDMQAKIDPYLRPLYDALHDMLPSQKLKKYLDMGTVEIVPLAFMRGRTLNNAFVILDEAQNTTTTQMKMFLTRLGANAKAIITGDTTQSDLPNHVTSGLEEAYDLLHDIEDISFVFFDKRDVVRHKLVRQIIEAYDNDTKRTKGKANLSLKTKAK